MLVRLTTLRPRDSESHARLGELRLDLGKLEDAEASGRRAIELDAENAVARATLGYILEKRGRLQAALEQYLMAAKIRPDWPQIHVDIGFIHTLMDQLPKAEKSLRTALELDRHHVEANLKLGVVLYRLRKFREARKSFGAVLKKNPDQKNKG